VLAKKAGEEDGEAAGEEAPGEESVAKKAVKRPAKKRPAKKRVAKKTVKRPAKKRPAKKRGEEDGTSGRRRSGRRSAVAKKMKLAGEAAGEEGGKRPAKKRPAKKRGGKRCAEDEAPLTETSWSAALFPSIEGVDATSRGCRRSCEPRLARQRPLTVGDSSLARRSL
jgi:hypothetical protein